MDYEDRISQLPQHILQNHILCLLPKKVAVGTCLLSKSWRHLGLTLPKFKFEKHNFPGTKQEFLSVVEKTLQRYDDQKLSIQEFVLEMFEPYDSESISLLNKWIPKVITNMGVKTFSLYADSFTPPLVVFQAEFLEELVLQGCKLDRINNCINVNLHVLKRLELIRGEIDNETCEKIISSCPWIEHLVLRSCQGLSNVKVNKVRNLKHFYCQFFDSIEIDDVPSLETIRIEDCKNWYHLHNNNNSNDYFFPRLKSLYLCRLDLPTELLNNLLSNCPSLEELQLHDCHGFSEFKLSNSSLQRLIINIHSRPIKAVIDAANMLYFQFGLSGFLPCISFATTSREWKSRVHVGYPHSDADALSTWILKLKEFLNALSQSQISLEIYDFPLMYQVTFDGGSCEPVVVEHLFFGRYLLSSTIPDILNCLFRICRPRYIGVPSFTHVYSIFGRQAEYTWKTMKGETKKSKFWKQDLEETSIQVLDENTNEWRSVQESAFPNNENIQFRLKWRDSSEIALVH